jgi:hypothetical protein
MLLTNYFFRKEIEKLARKAADRPHQYRSIADVKSILFVCDAKDWDMGRHCIERLKTLKKTVHTAIYAPTEKDVPTWYSNYLLFRADRDVTIWGFPESSIQKQFNDLQADLILDFSGERSPAMYYLVLQHPSTFKTGIKRSAHSVYDFSIILSEENDNLAYLFDQIFNYLQSIPSKPLDEAQPL